MEYAHKVSWTEDRGPLLDRKLLYIPLHWYRLLYCENDARGSYVHIDGFL